MKVAIIDGIAAHYRLLLFQKLSQQVYPDYYLYASCSPLNGIATISSKLADLNVSNGGIKWKLIDNIVVFNRIIWQKDILRVAAKEKYDLYIFIGEFHAISTWIGVALCKIRNKKVAFWGHGSYGNERCLKKIIRKIFNRLPDGYLVYNERAKELLIHQGVKKENLFVINNSLNFDLHKEIRESISSRKIDSLKKKLFPSSCELPVLLFIGRLIPEKRIDQLIQSIDKMHQSGKKINCLIIGSGSEEGCLKNLTQSLNLEKYIHFFGPSYDETENGLMLSLADCCVSPGNVGLTAIHSMSFGTPVITHNDFSNQGPEASSIIENHTGEFFERNNVYDLAEKIKDTVFFKGKNHYSKNCIKMIKDYYNPDYQVEVFKRLAVYLTAKNNSSFID